LPKTIVLAQDEEGRWLLNIDGQQLEMGSLKMENAPVKAPLASAPSHDHLLVRFHVLVPRPNAKAMEEEHNTRTAAILQGAGPMPVPGQPGVMVAKVNSCPEHGPFGECPNDEDDADDTDDADDPDDDGGHGKGGAH
jgi:hypothetical protein